jgi:heptosyltransferase III
MSRVWSVKTNTAATPGRSRPWLTEACEWMVARLARSHSPDETLPLLPAPRRILAVKVHGMGDSIMIRSALEHVQRRHSNADIGVLVGPATREVMSRGSQFRVHQYDPRSLSVATVVAELRNIRRQRYDAILNFEQSSVAGTAFLRATGIPARIGFIPPIDSPKALFLTHYVRFCEQDSMWKSFLRLVRVAYPDLSDDLSTVPLSYSDETDARVNRWWATEVRDKTNRVLGLHLGCGKGMEYRLWPIERFVSLAKAIKARVNNLVVVLTGTANEKPLIHKFSDLYEGPVVDASGGGSIETTALILKRCDLFVSIDTGVMHLAAAMGTPTVGLFGPNTPKHWAPIGPRAGYVYATTLSCSPCINNYTNSIPSACANIEKSRCMLDIDAEAVLRTAKDVIIGSWLV